MPLSVLCSRRAQRVAALQRHVLQLFREYSEALPAQLTQSLQFVMGLPQGLPLVGHAWNTSLERCLKQPLPSTPATTNSLSKCCRSWRGEERRGEERQP
ncbi:hypothetical protein D4764_20G0008740 [Takifugu flavidus]|uniref:Uncharacterized protein n=1 Tax=Takifugu flavidus TaxID=433684 RepID=A0A5C6NGZ4_9TELE|nr:hypothetical protein D4764_20G0008740 [Takifugu flavidus]